MFSRSSLKHKQSTPILEHKIEETKRLQESASGKKEWRKWGPYLSERHWGTVREDYSEDGNYWDYFTHDQARSRAYRWGEDGLLGFTDDSCHLCFGIALWNGRDPILKERFFGLSPKEGNHGEDVKECYYYLDSTPTHSYMKALYKYPHNEYPYQWLVEENRRRSRLEPEFELMDTGVFNDDRYWDIHIEYCKSTPNDILTNIVVTNRGPDTSTVHLLPTLWYRNTWIWGSKHDGWTGKPSIVETSPGSAECIHEGYGRFMFVADVGQDNKTPHMMFTDNETNTWRLFNNCPNYTPYVKDAFHRYIINGDEAAIHPQKRGTKMAAHYILEIPAGGHEVIRCRLMAEDEVVSCPFAERSFGSVLAKRRKEADEFYKFIIPESYSPEKRSLCRQSYANLLWNKIFFNYIVRDWLDGDEDMPTPPHNRLHGRNSDLEWGGFHGRDIVCVPDKWEYSTFSSYDIAQGMQAMAKIDPEFAKTQLLLLLHERFMAPYGQIPGKESDLSSASSPILALVCHRVYKMTARAGKRDLTFLTKCFHKLLVNFTWWCNRKDVFGKTIFGGGVVGTTLGACTRYTSEGETQEKDKQLVVQTDASMWMAFYCVTMLDIALDLALSDPSYEDMACKFLEHFIQIVDIIDGIGGGVKFWDDHEGFFYNHLHVNTSEGSKTPLRTRSLSGLLPLISCIVIEDEHIEKLPEFRKHFEWIVHNKTTNRVSFMDPSSESQRHRLLSLLSRERLTRVLQYALNEEEFLSSFGIRSLSRHHQDNPIQTKCLMPQKDESEKRKEKVWYEARYNPHESAGNTNPLGPVWLCSNFMIIDALEKYDFFFGDTFKVNFPSYSGNCMRLGDVATELSRRSVSLFLPNEHGRRPCHGGNEKYAYDVYWNQLLQSFEYFNGDTGLGYGASHMTNGTALISLLINKLNSSDS